MKHDDGRVPVGVLISGSGTNLQALLDAAAHPDFPARIAVVISNRRDARGLERARAAGVPAVWVPHRRRARADFEAALVARLQESAVQWVALAGFMRLLGPTLLDAFPGRVLNIHPSLLPAFPGLDAQGQAVAAGVRVSGCTVHFIDGGTDTGPIVAQAAVPVLPGDDRDALAARILVQEHDLFPAVLRMAVEGRLRHRGPGQPVSVELHPGEALLRWGG